MSNKSILASNKFVDWTAKVSDNYSLPAYEKKGYTLAFRNEDDNYTKSYEEDLGQEPTDEIIESYSLQDIINKYRVSPDYKISDWPKPGISIQVRKSTLCSIIQDAVPHGTNIRHQ